MKRFIVFAGNESVPQKGFENLVGQFKILSDAVDFYRQFSSNAQGGVEHIDTIWTWCQVVDIKNGKLAWHKGLAPATVEHIRKVLNDSEFL